MSDDISILNIKFNTSTRSYTIQAHESVMPSVMPFMSDLAEHLNWTGEGIDSPKDNPAEEPSEEVKPTYFEKTNTKLSNEEITRLLSQIYIKADGEYWPCRVKSAAGPLNKRVYKVVVNFPGYGACTEEVDALYLRKYKQ